jgi:hypothetical protein
MYFSELTDGTFCACFTIEVPNYSVPSGFIKFPNPIPISGLKIDILMSQIELPTDSNRELHRIAIFPWLKDCQRRCSLKSHRNVTGERCHHSCRAENIEFEYSSGPFHFS